MVIKVSYENDIEKINLLEAIKTKMKIDDVKTVKKRGKFNKAYIYIKQ